LYATTTNGTLVPVPDYTEYQDQADQLDDLTGRIAMVTKALKVAGLYPSDEREIARLFNEGVENQLLPVTNWAAFMEKGGLEKVIMLLPIEKISAVLRDLTEIRGVIKNDLYEITGIADIIRGSTKANETATAQRIKGQYATMRLSDKQQEVARFVRDILRMMGEIMCEHFSPQTLLLMSDYDQSDDPGLEGMQKTIAAIELLKNDKIRGFRIEIEDESTIAQDDEAEKAGREQFLQATSAFLQQAVPAGQAVPEMAPLLGKMLMYGVRGWRVGRDLETAFEDTLSKMEKAQAEAAGQPKPPSPDEIKAKAEMDKAQMQMQADQQKSEAEGMKYQAEIAIRKMEMEAAEREATRKHEFDMAKLEIELAKAKNEKDRIDIDRRVPDAIHEKTLAELEALDRQKRLADTADAQTGEMTDRMDQIDGGLMEVAKTMNESHNAVVEHLKQLSAPKRIIRGPDGRATGVELLPQTVKD
jgi:hypothetical protein